MNGENMMTNPTKERVIVYQPRAWTKSFHETDKRWRVIVAHRRSGKTTASINHLIRDASRINKSRFAYIAPTYKQAKNVAWDILKEYTEKFDGVKFNESELRVDFQNGSRITLYGADNPDSLRGLGLWGVVFDEYSQQPSNIFTEIIRPSLADHEGYAIWIGTPKGKNDFYRLYLRGLNDPDWFSMLLSVEVSGLINKKELDDAEKVMTPDEFQQEWYCSFEAAIQGAYYSTQIRDARAEGRMSGALWEPGIKVSTAWDIGIGDATSIWFFQRVGMEIRLIDYYETTGEGFPYFVKILNDKNYIYSHHFGPHDLRNREVGTGKTRLELAQKLGINFTIVPKLPIEEGIDAVRRMFNKCWFDDKKCAVGIDALIHYHKEWDDKQGQFKEHPFHDWSSHGADAFRYLALGRSEGEIGAYVEDPEIAEFEEIKRRQETGRGTDVLDPF
jgi:hypothetical protein